MFRGKKRVRKRERRVSSKIANRLNFLFFLVIVVFTGLILRLFQMQVLNRDFYMDKLTQLTTYTVKSANPRGLIYDAKDRPLVANDIKEVVAFTRDNDMSGQYLIDLAQKLSSYVDLTETKVTDREKRDYYLADASHYRQIVETLPKEQKYDKFGNRLSEATVYANAVAAVSEDLLTYSDDELAVIYAFSRMNATQLFATVSLKTGDLSHEQIAKLAADKEDLKGITVRPEWYRRTLDTSLASIVGQVSSEDAGLPAEEAEAYLDKGYALNDRVGTSYLEKSYEDYLQGKRTVRKVELDRKGQIVYDAITEEGQKGQNIKLTIDLDFQADVENILERYFKEELEKGHTDLSEGIYAVAIEPDTGAVKAMAGLKHDVQTNTLTKNALGTITEVFTPGSVIKAATLSAGWENGVLSGNTILNDQVIQFASSQPIKSWFTGGPLPITATEALEYSSNPYMVQVALKLMGQDYVPNMLLGTGTYQDAMDKLRDSYAQYGLGVSTGIDLPNESVGYIPKDYDVANVLTESFGQFDNYTTMQLAQYVATIANGGERLAPRLVEGVYDSLPEGGLGSLSLPMTSDLLNNLAISKEDLALIQKGFYDVVNSGRAMATGRRIGEGAALPISAKTGTAEAYVRDKDGKMVYTSNLNVVAYAPSDNPKIAVAVVLPHEKDLQGTVSYYITRDIINRYHERTLTSEQEDDKGE